MLEMHAILDSIDDLLERAEEAQKAWHMDRTDNLAYGRLLAFCEALSIIKWDFVGVEAVKQRLDFDIDQRFMI